MLTSGSILKDKILKNTEKTLVLENNHYLPSLSEILPIIQTDSSQNKTKRGILFAKCSSRKEINSSKNNINDILTYIEPDKKMKLY